MGRRQRHGCVVRLLTVEYDICIDANLVRFVCFPPGVESEWIPGHPAFPQSLEGQGCGLAGLVVSPSVLNFENAVSMTGLPVIGMVGVLYRGTGFFFYFDNLEKCSQILQ